MREIAEWASLQSFLNAYLRETGACVWQRDRTSGLWGRGVVPLARLGMAMWVDVAYRSPTGRHRYGGKLLLQPAGAGAEAVQVDPMTAMALMVRELTASGGGSDHEPTGLLSRIVDSCKRTELILRERGGDSKTLYGEAFYFIETEQSLLFGHAMHPTPKSREGVPEWQERQISPECNGAFRLHWFSAHRSLIREGSEAGWSASKRLLELAREDAAFPRELLESLQEDSVLLPLHPLQAAKALEEAHVREWMERGLLKYLGPIGRPYLPTSSLRTVYHEDAAMMLKLSIPVKLTNSVRVNKSGELSAGVEAAQLWKTELGERLAERYPQFRVVQDPAWITLHDGRAGLAESGFEIILRDNPFRGEDGAQVTLIAALTQDAMPGCGESRLAILIRGIAEREGLSIAEASMGWFRRYLDIALKPMLWLYAAYGIGLEAHGQNSLIRLKDGYPDRFYYRDNQGYYYRRSMAPRLNGLLPGIGVASGNLYDDDLVDERVKYYLFINHLFGLINGFGMAGFIEEGVLLAELRTALESCQAEFQAEHGITLTLIDSLLSGRTIACKANLLTQLSGMDELEQPLEQAVYVNIDNPLVSQLPGREVLQRAKRATMQWRQERMRHG